MESIETTRLIIRRFLPSDWKDLYDYLSDKNVVKFEPYDVFSEEDCIKEAVNRSQSSAFWAVCMKENGKLIGNLYFMQQQPLNFSTWELGYVFNADYQGSGYATESCMAIIDYAFVCLKARRIIASCDPENIPSWRLLERLKLRKEGHLIKSGYFKCDLQGNPIWHDTFKYAILSDEWQTVAK